LDLEASLFPSHDPDQLSSALAVEAIGTTSQIAPTSLSEGLALTAIDKVVEEATGIVLVRFSIIPRRDIMKASVSQSFVWPLTTE